MMVDCVDYGEFITGRRITGLTFSGALFALKMGMAFGGAALGWLPALAGYNDEAGLQSESTTAEIAAIFTLAPAVGHLVLTTLVRRYRLDRLACDEIRQALAQRQHGGRQ